MSLALILALLTGDPVTEAGTAYRQALEAVESENYEGAIQLLSGALQRVGEESDQLKYRDNVATRTTSGPAPGNCSPSGKRRSSRAATSSRTRSGASPRPSTPTRPRRWSP